MKIDEFAGSLKRPVIQSAKVAGARRATAEDDLPSGVQNR